MKENIIMKINQFVDKVVSYVNSFEVDINNVQQPVYATNQVAQQVTTQTVQPQNIQLPQQTVSPVNNNLNQ